MCAIDWRLILEFVKALAAPTAGVVSVLLVSYLGLRAFKAQKAVERRLQWYDTAYCLLDRTAKAFAVASIGGSSDAEKAKLFDDAMNSSTALGDHLGQSWLYADQASHDVVGELGKVMEEVDLDIQRFQRIDGPSAERIANACLSASLELANGMRRNLGLPKLVVSM